MVGRFATLAAICVAVAAIGGCATRPPVEAKSRPSKPAETRPAQSRPVETNNATAAVPATANPAPLPAPPEGVPTPTARELAILRVEAGALVTRVNGDPKLACTQPDCSIPLPPGTHKFTVGYKDTETRAGSRVTYASMHARVIEVTLEPGHTYSLTASGRYAPKWWIAIEDQTANKTVYNDRAKPR